MCAHLNPTSNVQDLTQVLYTFTCLFLSHIFIIKKKVYLIVLFVSSHSSVHKTCKIGSSFQACKRLHMIGLLQHCVIFILPTGTFHPLTFPLISVAGVPSGKSRPEAYCWVLWVYDGMFQVACSPFLSFFYLYLFPGCKILHT